MYWFHVRDLNGRLCERATLQLPFQRCSKLLKAWQQHQTDPKHSPLPSTHMVCLIFFGFQPHSRGRSPKSCVSVRLSVCHSLAEKQTDIFCDKLAARRAIVTYRILFAQYVFLS